MFVAISTYLKPLEEVDRFSAAHGAWIMKHYASGRILGSGRRVPPIGGIILARGESKEEFLALLSLLFIKKLRRTGIARAFSLPKERMLSATAG